MRRYLTYDDVQISMTYSEVPSRSMCKIGGSVVEGFDIDFPIISAPMTTVTGFDMAIGLSRYGGIGCLHRFDPIEVQVADVNHLLYNTGKFICAVGVTGDYFERATELYKAGSRVFCLDIAHGHHVLQKIAITRLKEAFSDIKIIGGNIATGKAAADLTEWGADGLRVGIGAGAMCETRIRTGVGVPMITCLQDVRASTELPIIADGGIRYPGDVAKAIAAGANTVMLGSVLAGTKETPGQVISIVKNWPYEEKYKKYSGSASMEAKMDRGEGSKNVEGNSTLIPYKGKMKRILDDISDGLQSSFSYNNAFNQEEFHRNAELIEVTNAGAIEATPHGLR